MAAEAVSLRQNADAFIGEMEKGLKGEESSLFMIPPISALIRRYLPASGLSVVDAGGTNFRWPRWFLTTRQRPLSMISTNYPMPGTQGEITIEEFVYRGKIFGAGDR